MRFRFLIFASLLVAPSLTCITRPAPSQPEARAIHPPRPAAQPDAGRSGESSSPSCVLAATAA